MLMRNIFRKYCQKTQNEDKEKKGVIKKTSNLMLIFYFPCPDKNFFVRIEAILIYGYSFEQFCRLAPSEFKKKTNKQNKARFQLKS